MKYNTVTWGCRHCGDVYEGSPFKGTNDKCPHCGLLQSENYESQVKIKKTNKQGVKG